MIEESYRSLISAIRSKSMWDEVIWTKTSSKTKYKLKLETFTIVIDKWMTASGETVSLDIIQNSNGEALGKIQYNSMSESNEFTELNSFYCDVESYHKQRNQSYISAAISEISKPGKIGKLTDD